LERLLGRRYRGHPEVVADLAAVDKTIRWVPAKLVENLGDRTIRLVRDGLELMRLSQVSPLCPPAAYSLWPQTGAPGFFHTFEARKDGHHT
jgi:hypothetical protein